MINSDVSYIPGLTTAQVELFDYLLAEAGLVFEASERIPRRTATDPLPLSFAQQRLWFLDQLVPNNPFYNIAECFRLNGFLDSEALTQSLNTLVARHEALRTVFTTQAGEPVQVVLPPQLAPLTLVDLRTLPEAERAAEALRLANAEAQRPFDLSTGPLLRLTLLRFSPTEHWLVLVVHNIIFDAWSTGVFQNELVTLYRAYVARQPVPLPEPPIQYGDYALWERQWSQTEQFTTQLTYWKRQLAGLPVLELTTDHPRPAVQTYRGTTQTLTLPQPLTTALRNLSQQTETTLFMVLLAAFKTLLHRYAGQVDIPVGVLVANRQSHEVKKLLGFFTNTLVLRSDFSDNPTFWALLQRVRETTLEAQAYQNLPFNSLVEELQLKRTLSHAPLFQVAFALENTPELVAVTPDLTLEQWKPAELSVGAAKFDLSLFVADGQQALTVTLEYNTDLFDRTTIVRLLGHWQNLLEAITANPHQRVANLPILQPAELEELLYTWNARTGEFPNTQTLAEHFEAHAARTPNALAVCLGDQILTYQELNSRANQLAHYLRAHGVTRGALVGVCVPRGPAVLLGLLAALKAGAAYVPLDPAYPQERLNYMLEEAQVAWLLTQAEILPRLAGYTGRVLCLDADWPQVAPQSAENLPSGTTIADLAYVIYTSGSTGRPKGVACEHTGVLNLIADFQARHPLQPGDACCLWASTSFDASIYEIFSALLVGGSLHLPPDHMRADAERFSAWLADNQIRHAYIPPFFLEEFAAWLAAHPGRMQMRRLMVGVEPILEQLLVTIKEHIPGLTIVNAYGPTETSICSTLYTVGTSAPPGRNTPIGRPVQNMQVYLLDRFMQPVPIGVSGELYVGGTGLAWGYLNRPRITTEKFIPNPFSTAPGERLYRTGDLARYLPDGNIEFLGRADQQVKIRGFRIELGEIEKVLEEHLAVQAAVVLARQDRPGDKRLVAYVVTKRTYTLTSFELRAFAQKKLPDYMVPLAFIFLEHLPLTPNGKLDQRALPVPDWTGLDQSEAFVPPQTPTEELLASIWAEVLHVERVGAQNNFFELGGHSLLATQIISRIRSVFQVELPLRQLFETPTVATLGKAVDASYPMAPTAEAQLRAIGRAGPLVLSFAQQRLWFLDQLEPGLAFYNIPVLLRLHGRLDFLALQRSLEALIHRHETLRTTFPVVGGQPQQHIAPPAPLVLPLVDLRPHPTAEREAIARQMALAEAQQPFDLAQGPLLRVKLLQLENDQHWLLLTLHHIISDGWSMNVLVHELSAFYEAFYIGRAPALPELPIQYADFAHWQRQWLQGERLAEQLDYWKQQLADAPALLELPTDHPRPAVQTYTGSTLKFSLSEDLSAALKNFARQTNVTPFMLFLAAYYVLLYRYAGQTDVVVGSPIAGRNVGEIEGLIGFFVNTLALRINLKDKPSFKTLLEQVRDLTIEAYTHQDIPFEKLVEELRPERTLSHTPLFQVMFVFNTAVDVAVPLPELKIAPMEVTSFDVAKFDLTLTVEDQPRQMVCEFEYNTDLFDTATIERLIGHFQHLLTSLLTQLDASVANLALLPADERQQLLHAWNSTQADYPQTKRLAELFEAQVQRTPAAPALVFGTQTLTYQELNRRANQVARRLQSLGVGPDQPVGLFIERTPEMAVGVLGILKAGGAYVPLDPTYPTDRLAFMVTDTGATIILTQRSLVPHVPDPNLHMVVLDEGWPTPTVTDDAPVPCPAVAENLAYVIFTAGSTGRPKGVGVTQRNVVNHALYMAKEYELQPQDRVLQFASISFDIAVEELFPCWFVGATLVLRTEDMLASAQYFLAVVTQQQLTVLNLPTAYWHDWTKDLTLLKATLPSTLRLVVVGGEKAAPATVIAWQALAGSAVRWVNAYGPTETTVTATLFDLRKNPGLSFENTEVPIGRPIANTTCYLLDAQLELVPLGAVGELYIGGAGVARGYLNRPDLTASKFIPDPFSTAPGQRLYATGDLARYLPDGNLQFLDRHDDQVKIRGFRIELGEIEGVIGRHPQVRTAVVVARASARGHQELVAYVVLQPEATLTRQGLNQYLKESLPLYMVPAAVMFLEALPMTPSGKINRRALPAPQSPEAEEAVVAPRTPTEEALAQIWCEVLALPELSIHSNFFELGGHSLLATQIMSRVRHTLQVELPLRTLFEAPTIAALAKAIETSHEIASDAQLRLRPIARTKAPALSFAQQRLWFLDQLEPGLAFYNIPVMMRLTGQLDLMALQRSVEALIHRHETLRTTFPALEGQPYQLIAPPAPFVLPITDLRPHPVAEREAMAQQLTQAEAQQAFDLGQGPLMRVKLIQLETDHHWLMLTFHHIIFDGWSTDVLMRELVAFYAAFQRGQAPRLPELPVQYADFAHWQRQWLQGARLEEQLAYWKRQLADAPALLELPTDRPRPPVQTYHGANYHLTLPLALAADLKALSQREGVTLFMTLFAAFQTLLYRYTGQTDVSVGAPIAGRHRAEIENLIGFFVNTLVLRTNLTGHLPFNRLLQQVRETVLEANAHQDVPFEKLVEELKPERNLSYPPLFQVLFTLGSDTGTPKKVSNLTLHPPEMVWVGAAKFDLGLEVDETPLGLACTFEYNTDLFDANTIARLAQHWQTLLASVCAAPTQPVATLPILTALESAQLLKTWNATQTVSPMADSMAGAFEAQVARTPEAVALVCEDEALTYATLNARANQLAHHLRTLGVGPEVLVAVCLERRIELVVALLAILKAGGAYVPLDPAYPADRVAFMLADTQAPVVITQTSLAPRLPASNAQVICVDTWAATLPAQTANLPWQGHIEQIAYIIYTSGSTGRPKGVTITHRSALVFFAWAHQVFTPAELAGVLAATSVCFDLSVFEIFVPLSMGGKVILVENALALPKTVARDQVTLVNTVPSAMLALVNQNEVPPQVQTVNLAGEPLKNRLAQALYQLGTVQRVNNLYGPSEDTTYSTWVTVPAGSATEPTIGRPIANTEAYVLDPLGQPVPIGVRGEVYLGGEGLARGYLHRPDLTADKFVPDPFSGRPGGRLYRTGDVARYLPNGELEFLGRIDYQVKIRGFRIEIGEVEATLSQHPDVREAVVVARENERGEKALVAYLSPQPGQQLTVGGLRKHILRTLPDYMVPAAFVLMDTLPLTPSGKIDRRALPAPQSVEPVQDLVPPRTPTEEALAEIWRTVLALPELSVHSNFFELGGHSLLATQIMSRVRNALQVELPLRTLFEAPSVAELANQVEQAQRAQQDGDPLVLGPMPRPGVFPLSFSQQRLWFLDQLEPANPLYNISLILRLTGPLNLVVLEQSLKEIARRHESLRTHFVLVDREPIQMLQAEIPVPLRVVDLETLAAPLRAAEAQRLLEAEAQQPFSLTQSPLWRLVLVRLSAEDHRLLIIIHHIISDGWSMGVFLRELTALYEAYSLGRSSPLPELPVQYADFSVWQRQWLQGRALEAQLAYWRKQLTGSPSLLELPTDRPRPAVQTYHGAACTLTLSAPLSQALKALCQQTGTTLFMTLLAAFQLLLHRYAGQEDVLVGVPIANRHREEIENLIGFFINTLVIRANFSGVPTFKELLMQVREVALGAYAHQDLPFEKLVEELQPERSLSHNPLFQVFFNLFTFEAGHHELPDLTLDVLPTADAWSKFDLTLYAEDQPAGINLELVYNADLFNAERMIAMLQQIQYLLEQIVANPSAPIHAYSLVAGPTHAVLPNPQVELPMPYHAPIPHHLLAWAERLPNQPAISQGTQQWSYAVLASSARALAQTLLAHGVERGARVAVLGHRSFGLIASMWAVFLSGGVLVPLDPSLPTERQSLMCREGGVNHLLCIGEQSSAALVTALPSLTVISVAAATGQATGAKALATAGQNLPEPEIRPEDPAYLFFTSGTTGVPKGVLGCHRGLSHFLNWQRETFAVKPGDRSGQLTALSFDVVLRDIFLSLTSGATLCLPERSDDLTPEYILPWLEREKISLLHSVPTLAQSWLEAVPSTVTLQHLRWIFFAGEPLTASLVTRWRAAFPQTGGIVNLYGPTETTLAKFFYIVPPEAAVGIQPVGQPQPQTQGLVLNRAGQLCGIGEPGEIVIRTPFRSLGYLNVATENQKRFVKNPYRTDETDLLYYTGDRGRYRPDGLLEILGRLDHQVKIRGVRVEPDEVTEVLVRHPGVAAGIVVSWKNEEGQYFLAAYVVAKQPSPPTIAEVRDYLSRHLVPAMVPAVFIFLDQLPRTPNGKVDRRALPQPTREQWATPEQFAAPTSSTEMALAKIWGEVLGREQLSVQANFFDLGGHSLLAMQIVSRIRQVLEVELPLRQIFETPTVAGLAHAVATLQREQAEPPLLPLPPAARTNQLPLSFAQQRMWFLDRFEPGNAHYNIPLALRLKGRLDVPALEHSFTTIVERHTTLRTVFVQGEGAPYQKIVPAQPLQITVQQLSDLLEHERTPRLQHLMAEAAQQPFDLTRGPLFRLNVWQVAPHEHVLLFTIHHIIADAWSLGLITQEFAQLYTAAVNGAPPPLPPLALQYVDFAAWQIQWLQGPVLEKQLHYWKNQLAAAPTRLELPTDHPRPAIQTFNGARQTFVLPAALVQTLKQLGQREQGTLFMVLLAAFQTLLYRYTGQSDILVGTPIAGRHQADLEKLVGLFINTLVLRSDLSGNPTFRELLARVRETTLDAYAHQDVPFEKLVDELHLERNLSHPPLFQVMFVLYNIPLTDFGPSGLTVSVEDFARDSALFDLTLAMGETETGMEGWFEYNTDLFQAATITRMVGHFRQLLETFAAQPTRRLLEASLLTPAERHQLLVAWNETSTVYPAQASLTELFEAQVARTPTATAVVFENQTLTYQALNQRANQLAHYLKKLGVGPDVLVGVCMDRSLEMVISLYAIHKAGGAYVPLDPTYPAARLAYMVADANVPVLLTQAHLVPQIPEHHAQLVCVDEAWPTIATESSANPVRQVRLDNAAYMIYTSGSTGMPKGVINSHRGISNRLLWMQAQYHLTSADRVLQKTPFSFDVSVWEFFWPLLSGASLVVARPEGHKDSAYLVQTIEAHQITTLHFVPSMLQAFLNEPEVGRCRSVRQVMCSGEALPYALQERFFASLPTAELHNLYGPTEAAVDVTYWPCERNSAQHLVPIGYPIANIQIYITDSRLQPVPVGVSGELYLGGVGLARGYHNRPDLTAEKFVPDPFSPVPGARLYKTGDAARYLPNGSVDFLGRLDFQVKIRGFRIELGEIETALGKHPDVRGAVVIVREDIPGSKRLVAYLTTTTAPSVSALRDFLHERLPDYMVPAAFVMLEEFPLTPSGKINRKALPAPDQGLLASSATFVPPTTPTEIQLAEIWAQVLRVQQVGLHNNFFELGGDSILSLQIITRANQVGLNLTPKQIFQYQTIAELARHVGAAPTVHAEQGLVTGVVPLLPIQHWFFEQGWANPHHFNQSTWFALPAPLTQEQASQVVQALLAQHDVLRLRFTLGAEGWQQSLADLNVPVPLRWVDLAHLPAAEQAAQLEKIANECQTSLHLTEGPVLRVAYCELGPQQPARMLFVIHHMAVDGVSWRVLQEDLQQAQQQVLQGAVPQLPAKTTSFKYWAERLTTYAQSAALQAELDFWLTQPVASVPLPLDYPTGANTEGQTAHLTVSLEPAETRILLQDLPAAYHTQINDALLTAFLLAYTRWTGARALQIDLEGHGREPLFDEVNLARTMGWFTSIFPVWLHLSASAQPEAALKAVKEQLRHIPQHGIGYGVLRYLSQDPTLLQKLRAQPTAAICFNYLGQFDETTDQNTGVQALPAPSGADHSPEGVRAYQLDITSVVENGQLQVRWVYGAQVFKPDTIAKFAQGFLTALRELLSLCQAPNAGGFTPSDFPEADLNQDELDDLLAQLG